MNRKKYKIGFDSFKAMILVFTLLIVNHAFSQTYQSKLKVKFNIRKSQISELKDATVFITITSKFKGKIAYMQPIHFGNDIKDGDIFFEFFKKDSIGNFIEMHTEAFIDRDIYEKRKKMFLNYKDSIAEKCNLNQLGFLTKGDYKVRCVYVSGYNPKFEFYYSKWIYLKVLKDIVPKEGTIIEY